MGKNMSNESPLNFFSSTAKKKPENKTPSSAPIKGTSGKKSFKELVEAKRPKNPQREALMAAAENMAAQSKEIEERIEEMCRITKQTPETLINFLQANDKIPLKVKQELNKLQKELTKAKEAAAKGEPMLPDSLKNIESTTGANRPGSTLRAKSRGSKKKWMPIK